jgi:hypothetical protein
MRLFYDDEFDAINTAIADSGKTFKEVANHMFPDMKPESAADAMNQALKKIEHLESMK